MVSRNIDPPDSGKHRYAIITTGSRGDVQPFIALALTLIRRGRDVTIAASENFRDLVQGSGIAFIPIAGDSEQIINSPEALRLLEGGNVFKFIYHLLRISSRTAAQASRDILHACESCDHLIVSVLPLPIVYSIAERYDKKCAVVFLSLPPIPTREFPYLDLGVPSWLNKISYRLVGLAYRMTRKQTDRFRQEIGLPPANLLKAILRSNMLALLAESQQLIPQPGDWPPNAHVTGFFYHPPKAGATLPPGLEDWIKAGDKPVYIGSGSIPIPDPQQFYTALQGVLAKKRVVLATGWSVLNDLPLHPGLFSAKYVDHEWLLPHCSVAVIHGGIGTIAAVLKSGIPGIVVSILADQPMNGKMIHRRGLGYHLPFKKLNAEKLLHAIDAVGAPQIADNCRIIAEHIRTENGVDKAARLLEDYFEGS